MLEARRTTKEEEAEGKRRGIPPQGISEGIVGHTDGTPSERITPAAPARGREKATRQRQQAATRWEDPPGNQRNINTINCKHH